MLFLVEVRDQESNLLGVYGDWPDHEGLARLLQENGWQPKRPGAQVLEFARETELYGVLTAHILCLRRIHDLEADLGVSSIPSSPVGPLGPASSVVH